MPAAKKHPQTTREPEAPDLPATLPDETLAAALASTSGHARVEIDGLRLSGDCGSAQGESLALTGCVLERCALNTLSFRRISMADCLLRGCDLSGLNLVSLSLQRVRVEDCRLTGLSLAGASLHNVVFTGCTGDYLALDSCVLGDVLWERCRLRESTWQNVKLQDTALRHCDLTAASVLFTPLAGLNLTTCEFDGLQADLRDLRGARVNTLQAVQLCAALGLLIEE